MCEHLNAIPVKITKLAEEHCRQAVIIMHYKNRIGDPSARADQLVFAMRHLLCCWILTEATEQQLQEVVGKYYPKHTNPYGFCIDL